MNMANESKMIHRRSLGGENGEDGVSYRVVACRNRLRSIRAHQEAQIPAEMSLQLEESMVASAKRGREPKPG
jgi:hypothetical protein